MCFNSGTSLATFIFGITCAFYLLHRGIKYNHTRSFLAGILLFVVAPMQLLEYFLWENQDNKNINSIVSIMIFILIALQPLIFYYFALKYKNKELKKNYRNINNILITIFIIISLYLLYVLIRNKNSLYSTKDKNSCRLRWDAFVKLYYKEFILFLLFLAFYLYLFFFNGIYKSKDLNFKLQDIYLVVTLIIAILFSVYYKGKYFFFIFGSLWCFLVVFYGILAIFDL